MSLCMPWRVEEGQWGGVHERSIHLEIFARCVHSTGTLTSSFVPDSIFGLSSRGFIKSHFYILMVTVLRIRHRSPPPFHPLPTPPCPRAPTSHFPFSSTPPPTSAGATINQALRHVMRSLFSAQSIAQSPPPAVPYISCTALSLPRWHLSTQSHVTEHVKSRVPLTPLQVHPAARVLRVVRTSFPII